MKIKVFDPLYTQSEFLRDLVQENISFEVFFSNPINEIDPYNFFYLDEKKIPYKFFNEKDFDLNKDDLLIPCTDQAVNLTDSLNRKYNNIYADKIDCSLYKKDRSQYLETFELDNIKFPCVIKRKKSLGGGKDTFIIFNNNELTNLNVSFDDFFIQPWYEGTEYAVDFISKNGEHYLIGVWEYYKAQKFTSVLSKVKIVNDENLQNKVYNSIVPILNSIGRLNGASHIEIILSNNQIKIVEINFRFHGHVTNYYYKLATGLSHTMALIKTFIKKEKIPKIYNHKLDVYRICGNVTKVIHESKINYNMLENIKSICKIFQHPSFNLDKSTYGPTKDMFSAVCMILMYDNPEFENDIQKVNKWIEALNQ